jgi:hypothetical protein
MRHDQTIVFKLLVVLIAPGVHKYLKCCSKFMFMGGIGGTLILCPRVNFITK